MRLFVQSLASERGMPHFLAALRRVCERAASPGTSVKVVGTRHGGVGDEFRLFWHHDVREVVDNGLAAGRAEGFDAVVLANSLEPALIELREILDVPVVSFMESACFAACSMGGRFGLVVPTLKMEPRYREIVTGLGLGQRLAAIEAAAVPSLRGLDSAFAQQEAGDALVEAVTSAARRCLLAGAEVIVPVAAPTALLSLRGVHDVEGALLLDGYTMLVRQAEAIIGYRRATGRHISRRGTYLGPSRETLARIAQERGLSGFED